MSSGGGTRYRAACLVCGGTRRRAFWATEAREQVLARCLDCAANFHGPGVWLPLGSTSVALSLEVDPHAGCAHRHWCHEELEGAVA